MVAVGAASATGSSVGFAPSAAGSDVVAPVVLSISTISISVLLERSSDAPVASTVATVVSELPSAVIPKASKIALPNPDSPSAVAEATSAAVAAAAESISGMAIMAMGAATTIGSALAAILAYIISS